MSLMNGYSQSYGTCYVLQTKNLLLRVTEEKINCFMCNFLILERGIFYLLNNGLS
jgi:hypothetical protein